MKVVFFVCVSLFTLPYSKVALLTNSTNKTWYLYAESPGSKNPTCQPTGSVFSDNTYTFYADGTFEFNHGTVTEDPNCQQEDCCSDFVNVVGTWAFFNSEASIQITALHEKGNDANNERLVLYKATILQLDENVLKISQPGQYNTTEIIEFRKK